MIDAACALASCWRKRDKCPPAMWPVSCASTPITSFGTFASINAPALMKMRRPSITKALNDAVVDDGDLNVLLGEARGAQDRLGVVAQQLLDLGVANDRKAGRQALRARGRRRDGGGWNKRDRERRQQRDRARGWRRPPHLDSAFGLSHVRLESLNPMFSQTSGAPREGQREPRSLVVARLAAPNTVRSGRMRQQRGRRRARHSGAWRARHDARSGANS